MWKLFDVSVAIYSWEETESTIANNQRRNPFQQNCCIHPGASDQYKIGSYKYILVLQQICSQQTIAKHNCGGRGMSNRGKIDSSVWGTRFISLWSGLKLWQWTYHGTLQAVRIGKNKNLALPPLRQRHGWATQMGHCWCIFEILCGKSEHLGRDAPISELRLEHNSAQNNRAYPLLFSLRTRVQIPNRYTPT